MYETLTFTGGIHKSEELKELIEDLGGFVLQSNILQMELVLNMAFCSSIQYIANGTCIEYGGSY